MWKSINMYIGLAAFFYCAFEVDNISTNQLVFWVGLALTNFIFAIGYAIQEKRN